MEGEHMVKERKLMEKQGMIESLSQKKKGNNKRISKLEAQIGMSYLQCIWIIYFGKYSIDISRVYEDDFGQQT